MRNIIMKLKKGEKGFTLIELVVGVGIAAFVVSAAAMTTISTMRLIPHNNDWAVALRQVQNAGYWISRDVQMSQGDIDVYAEPDEFLTLTVPVWDTGSSTVIEKTIVYELEDMGDGMMRLMRNNQTDGYRIMIAENITAAVYNDTGDIPNVAVTAASGTVTVTREYEAMQRIPPPAT